MVPVTLRTDLSEDRKSMQSLRNKNGRGEEEKRDGNKSTKINNE
jgi:hypothetical protein